MSEESEEPQLSSDSDSESQEKENNEKNSKNSDEILESKVIRKAKDRILPGFETSRDKSKWKSSFFFVQAADTQLGMIDMWGDGSVGSEYPNVSWDREMELCSQTVDLLNQYGFIRNVLYRKKLYSIDRYSFSNTHCSAVLLMKIALTVEFDFLLT